MINLLRKVERIFVCQQNSLIEPLITTPPIATLPIPLISGASVDLCSITIPIKRWREDTSFFISAFINWEMAGPASMPGEPPGTAQVSFELVRDDFVIFRATDTLVRPSGIDNGVAVFSTVNLAHLDVPNNCCCCSHLTRCVTFRVRANNIIFDTTATTAAVGAVNLRIEELRCG